MEIEVCKGGIHEVKWQMSDYTMRCLPSVDRKGENSYTNLQRGLCCLLPKGAGHVQV